VTAPINGNVVARYSKPLRVAIDSEYHLYVRRLTLSDLSSFERIEQSDPYAAAKQLALILSDENGDRLFEQTNDPAILDDLNNWPAFVASAALQACLTYNGLKDDNAGN